MRTMLEAADPLRRRELLRTWGGTTTASRKKWRDIVHIPKTEFHLTIFIQHYGLVWLAVYLSAWVVMRLLFPRWGMDW